MRNLRAAIEATELPKLVSRPHFFEVQAVESDRLHRHWCSAIRSALRHRTPRDATHGRAAKLVALYLKALVMMGDVAGAALAASMHPPIDRILLQNLARSPVVSSPHKREWRGVHWTKLDEEQHFRLVAQLRDLVGKAQPCWKLEEYRDDAEDGDYTRV